MPETAFIAMQALAALAALTLSRQVQNILLPSGRSIRTSKGTCGVLQPCYHVGALRAVCLNSSNLHTLRMSYP